MLVALDATYSVGDHLSGVGVYSRQLLLGLAALPESAKWLWCYRPHRFLRSFSSTLPPRCSRRLFWETYAPGADLFHGLNQRLPAAPLRRAVVTFHDLFVMTGDYSTPEFRARFEQQAREAARRADLIIAVSEFTAAQVESLLAVESSRIRVVRHGVVAPPARPPAIRRRMILSVGAIQRRKNIVRLVEAFERTPPGWSLVLAGSSGYQAGEVFRRIENSPRRADIEVTGYVDSTRLEQLYAAAAIFAFPSLDEGFGMPVLEAMARGIPVVTSNRSALPEVAGGAAMLVDPLRVESISQALDSLIADEDLRTRLARAGVATALLYSWGMAAAATNRCYRELIA